MAQLTGKNATLKIGTDTVLEMVTWTLNITAETVSERVFGDDWTKKVHIGNDWNGSFDGLYDPADTTGQVYMENATTSGTEITTLRFYVDATNYWTVDTGSDADAYCLITSWNPSADAGGFVRVTGTVEGSGPVYRTS
jgi:hypothetical protein